MALVCLAFMPETIQSAHFHKIISNLLGTGVPVEEKPQTKEIVAL
jgi:hypothetical protein